MYQIRSYVLSNGMMLYCLPTEDRTSNVSGIGFRAGSIYDPLGKKGLAHVVEHSISRMSRKNPDSWDQLLKLLRYLGESSTGWKIETDYTSVFYGHENLSRRRDMYDGFDVLALFVHPKTRVIDSVGMRDVELAAVSNEYYQFGTDVPTMVIDDLLYGALYTTNPIRWRIDGTLEQVRAFDARDARRFVERYYVPRNGFVVMLGPAPDKAKEIANQHFGDWKTPTGVPVFDYDHSDDVPELSGIKSVFASRDIHQYYLGMAWPTETYATEDGVAIDLLARILRTRIRRIREENTDPDAGAYRMPVDAVRTMVHGMFSCEFATTSREYVGRGEEIILEEVTKLCEDLPPRAEFEVAAANARAEYEEAFKTAPGTLADMIVEAATNGDPELVGIHNFRANLKKVTRHKVRDMAKKYLKKKAYVRAVVGPGRA